MLKSLKQPFQSWAHARRGHKTVVFILDEFDMFAKPFKQTVLYNLLDALQASSVQASPPLPDLAGVRCKAWSLLAHSGAACTASGNSCRPAWMHCMHRRLLHQSAPATMRWG